MFRLREDDEGIAMVFVALLLVMLIGMVAFAVDTAALYQERRELQNGADAAVLAIAEDCGRGTKPCDTATATITAEDYADDNADDARARIDELILDTSAQTVEVLAATETSDGGSIFKPFFAQVIGFDGSEVSARAKAAYGVPDGLSTLPIIFSDCEWQKFESTMDNWPNDSLAEDGTIIENSVATVYFHGDTDPKGPKGDEDCHYSPSGQDLPGGFGWTDENLWDSEGNHVLCTSDTEIGQWIAVDTGNTPSTGCEPEDLEAILGTEVAIPYFGTVSQDGVILTAGEALAGNGANAEYLVSGYSALVVTGYNFGGQYKAESEDQNSPSYGKLPCKGSLRCIEGHFVTGTKHSGTMGSGGDPRGLIIVKLTG